MFVLWLVAQLLRYLGCSVDGMSPSNTVRHVTSALYEE